MDARWVERGRPDRFEEVVVEDVAKDPRYLKTLDDTRSEMVVPVKRGNGDLVGLIDVESDCEDAFTPLDLRLLEGYASVVAGLWP